SGDSNNPAVWEWVQDHFSNGTTPIIDTWLQSETGATVLANLPGESLGIPGAAGKPLPVFSVKIVDDAGAEVAPGTTGTLAITHPWPGMARTVWGDPERYRDAYWADYAQQGYYVAGDAAR